jgi:hypothetical protein
VQTANIGAPVQLNEIIWLKPPVGLIVTIYVAVDPADTVVVAGEAESEKSATVCVTAGEVLPAKLASPP